MEVLILWYIVYGKTGYEATVHLAQLSWQMGDSDLTLFFALQCIPPDEACTSLNVDMILAMMHNKKTFTKPLVVITHEGKQEGRKMSLTCLIMLYI